MTGAFTARKFIGPTNFTTTSTPISLGRAISSLLVDNVANTTPVYILPYDSTAMPTPTATTANSQPVAGGTVQIVGIPPSCDAVAYVGTAATTVNLTAGEGL